MTELNHTPMIQALAKRNSINLTDPASLLTNMFKAPVDKAGT